MEDEPGMRLIFRMVTRIKTAASSTTGETVDERRAIQVRLFSLGVAAVVSLLHGKATKMLLSQRGFS